jgi:hypothetical protein
VKRMAGYAVALEAGHELGDYWVQTDDQASHKGDKGIAGDIACAKHVLSYVATQAVCVVGAAVATGTKVPWKRVALGLAVSGITHYAADRREHGLLYSLARAIPGKARFLELGVPRGLTTAATSSNWPNPARVHLDNPSLGTGAWALDQAWHKVLGVFVPALIMAGRDD